MIYRGGNLSQSSPLIVDDKVYVCDVDDIIHIFGLSRDKLAFAENEAGDSYEITGSPVFANGTLYFVVGSSLYAIQEGHTTPPPPKEAAGAKP